MYILWRIPKCNVLYIFIFCSILTKRSSEKYNTDIKCIYYTNRTYFFGCILVYGSHLFLSSVHVMKQEISKGRNYFIPPLRVEAILQSPCPFVRPSVHTFVTDISASTERNDFIFDIWLWHGTVSPLSRFTAHLLPVYRATYK